MPGYRIGVDVGGTKLAYGLFDEHFSTCGDRARALGRRAPRR